MESMFLTLIVILACGIVIGLMAGLIGIGGGCLVIPLLNLGFGLPILGATSTSLFTVCFTAASGLVGHIRNRTVNLKLAIVMAFFGVICSPLGALFAGVIPSSALSAVTACIMIIPLTQMIVSAIKQRKAHAQDKSREIHWSQEKLSVRVVLICMVGGVIAGFASGMVGLGGGFIIIPLMSIALKRGMHEIAATSTAFIFFTSIAGTITHGIAGDIMWTYGLMIVIGSIPGALLGARLSKKIDGLYLKIMLAVVLFLVIILLLVKGL